MQGFERPDVGLWGVSALAGSLLPEGGVFAFLGGHRGELFPDEQWADLFAAQGRPSEPATRMAAVMTLQALFDLSDREACEAVRFDLRWKFALGLPLDDPGIHPSSLCVWRKKIAGSARPYRVSDAVKKVIGETGILRGRRRRTVDSTIFEDAVASQDTVTQIIAAMRRVMRQVPGAAQVIAAACTGFDYDNGRRPVIGWSDPAAAGELVSALVNDADAVVAALRNAELDDGQAAALALLAAVAGQDVEPAEGSDGTDGRWRIAASMAEDRMVSQADPQSRYARKSKKAGGEGYRAHLAAEPSTGIITGEELTMACGDGTADAGTAARFLAREHGTGGTPDTPAADAPGGGQEPDSTLDWYGDPAYGTGELRAALAGAGDRAVIKPRAVAPAVEGGFTADDFAVDCQAGTATCPAGLTRAITAARRAYFTTACRQCPLRDRCTTSKTGKILVLGQHDQLLRQARRDWAQDRALRKDYQATRPNVERAIAQAATTRGRRIKLRYRGTAKNNAWYKTRTAAVNLRTLLRHGLARTHGTWTTACTPA